MPANTVMTSTTGMVNSTTSEGFHPMDTQTSRVTAPVAMNSFMMRELTLSFAVLP